MTTDGFDFSDSLLLQRLGWVFLHFLWQGLLVIAVLTLALHLWSTRGPRLHFRLACLALASLVMFPAATFVTSSPPADAATFSSFMATLGVGWLAGAGVLALNVIVAALSMEFHRVVGTRPLPPERQAAFRELARDVGVDIPVAFVESRLMGSLAAIGWRRPVVLIPSSSLHILTAEKLNAVVAHELAHIKRRDVLGCLVQSVLEVLLFFHPAVWCLTRLINGLREDCCDDLACDYCGDRSVYSSALLNLASAREITTSLSMTVDDGSLHFRIKRLLGLAGPRGLRWRGWSVLLSTAGLTMLLALGLGYAYRVQARPTDGPAVQPAVAVELTPDHLVYKAPIDIDLRTGGRYAFRTTLWTGQRRNTFRVYLETPGSVLMWEQRRKGAR